MQESQMIESEGSLTHQLLWYCSKPMYAWCPHDQFGHI